MKRLTVILLLFCYMIPAVGLSVTVHYCGGKFTSISVLASDNPKCACGKKAIKKHCCKDETTIFKIKDTQNLSKTLTPSFSQKFLFLPHSFQVNNHRFPEVSLVSTIPFLHPPPLQKSRSLFLLHGVFLI